MRGLNEIGDQGAVAVATAQDLDKSVRSWWWVFGE